MSTPVIRGVIGYTITPFTADGTLDLDALGTSIDSLIADGVHAIAPLGSTGEGAYLSDSEWETVVRFSQARIAGRVPSVVSVSDLTTARTVQRARLAQACGATAVMVLPIFLLEAYRSRSDRPLQGCRRGHRHPDHALQQPRHQRH